MDPSKYETSTLDAPQFNSSTESILDALRTQGRGEVKDLSAERKRYLLLDSKYRPKDFNEELLTGFVGRHELLDIWNRIETAIQLGERQIPGIYLAGPPGAGKSSSIYFCVIKARRSGYLAVYIARCDEWCNRPHVAKAFFLDAVSDASEAVKQDGVVPITVPKPPKIGDVEFPSWENFALASASRSSKPIDNAFIYVHGTMQNLTTPVVLFFDEQNGLYENIVNGRDAIKERGCVVMSGTTDTQFYLRMKGGHHEHVYTLTCLADDDFRLWLDNSTQFWGPIAAYYRDVDTDAEDAEDIRNEIATVTGRIPREMRQFCKCQEEISISLSKTADKEELAIFMSALQRKYLEELAKRMTDTYKRYLDRNKDRTIGILNDVLNLCIQANPQVVMDASFMSLGLVYRSKGATVFLTPTTRDVLLRETVKRMTGDPKSSMNLEIAGFLNILQDEQAAGGERGYAFEKLVFLRVLQMETVWLKWEDLSGVQHSTIMKIQHQLTLDVQSPPAHWQHMQEGTLVAHPREGEHRFDFVHYGKGVVTFLEMTVSDYAKTKVPSTTANGEAHLKSILAKIQKWIGQHYYTVKVVGNKLVAESVVSKKRKEGPPAPSLAIPALNYVVLTPRGPNKFKQARADRYAFIGICWDTYLDRSSIVSAEEMRSFRLSVADMESEGE